MYLVNRCQLDQNYKHPYKHQLQDSDTVFDMKKLANIVKDTCGEYITAA